MIHAAILQNIIQKDQNLLIGQLPQSRVGTVLIQMNIIIGSATAKIAPKANRLLGLVSLQSTISAVLTQAQRKIQ